MRFGRVQVYRGDSSFDNVARPRRKNLIRFLIFLFVFVACAAASLAYVFGRPPVYESVHSCGRTAGIGLHQRIEWEVRMELASLKQGSPKGWIWYCGSDESKAEWKVRGLARIC